MSENSRYFADDAGDDTKAKNKKTAGKKQNQGKKRPRQENGDNADGAEVFPISKKSIFEVKRENRWKQKQRDEKTRHGAAPASRKSADPYPGKAPVDPTKLSEHSRGQGVKANRVKTPFHAKMSARREKKQAEAEELSARTELLLDESHGHLTGDETHEFTGQIKQTELRAALKSSGDLAAVAAAEKGFELNLAQFGPYTLDYTRNGRHLVLGGRRGHVAAFEWQSKRLMCEINVQESVHDVQWLHTENLFAVAQKKWTYIYDNQGIEIHCLKKVDNVTQMEFLPYHFLLATASSHGFLSWIDVSVGKMVGQLHARLGPLNVMCQNPWNAVLCLGHSKGLVSMWTPNMKQPVAKLLAHKQPVRAVAVDRGGNYMATSSVDRSLKIWDVRKFGVVQEYRIGAGASSLQFSGRGSEMLGVAMDHGIEIYKDCCTRQVEHPYLKHKVFRPVTDMKFAPFEDIMGIGHAHGFSSILVPGSGEANFDALEVNPYQTKNQRREAEVKALLEKVQPELITLDPTKLGDVNLTQLEQAEKERSEKVYLKPNKIDFQPRNKTKGRGGTAKQYHIKRTVVEEEKLRNLKNMKSAVNESREGKAKQEKKPKQLLDRLK